MGMHKNISISQNQLLDKYSYLYFKLRTKIWMKNIIEINF